ncbi:hypothetical protein D3C87_902150 [compost metagenome]
MLLQCEFTRHLGHPSFTLAEEYRLLQRVPIKVLNLFTRHQKGPIGLGQTCEIQDRIIRALLIYINGGFCSNKCNIDGTRQEGRHCLIASGSRSEFHLQSIILEETFLQCNILRCIEHRTCYLAELDLRCLATGSAAAKHDAAQQHYGNPHRRARFSHLLPLLGLSCPAAVS